MTVVVINRILESDESRSIVVPTIVEKSGLLIVNLCSSPTSVLGPECGEFVRGTAVCNAIQTYQLYGVWLSSALQL